MTRFIAASSQFQCQQRAMSHQTANKPAKTAEKLVENPQEGVALTPTTPLALQPSAAAIALSSGKAGAEVVTQKDQGGIATLVNSFDPQHRFR